MPVIDSDGCPIDVEMAGPADAPALMLSNSLGTTRHMWDPQMDAFAGNFACCVTTGAATANPARRKAPTSWRCSAAMRSRCWTGSASRRRIGSDCRWAAWKAVAWRQCRRPHRQDHPVEHRLPLRRQDIWDGRIKLVLEKGLASQSSPAIMERWFTQGIPRTRARQGPIAHERNDAHDAARRLYRLLRGDARHGPSRDAAEDQGADT